MDRFSRQLLRCAALVGPNQAIALLEGCIRGDPIRCRHVTILEGIRLENQCLEMRRGIRLQQLGKDPSALVTATQSDVDFARALHDNLIAQSLDSRSQIAYELWHKSKAHKFDVVNDAIDIRIALEALFAVGGHAEIAHRLALRAAWYLGEDVKERGRYFEMLKKVYNLCSKAIHTSRLKSNDASINLLDQARSVCRSTLIRHIRERVRPDEKYWNALILGRAE